MQHVVNISDAKVSANPEDTIITHSLGSCIGVTLYDPITKVGGMLHFQLPTGTQDPVKSAKQPFMYGDTGLVKLIDLLVASGAQKKRLKCKLAGGAKMLVDCAAFDIGKRNHTSIRKALWQQGIMVDKEEVGGSVPRTMVINIKDGAVSLKQAGELVALA